MMSMRCSTFWNTKESKQDDQYVRGVQDKELLGIGVYVKVRGDLVQSLRQRYRQQNDTELW